MRIIADSDPARDVINIYMVEDFGGQPFAVVGTSGPGILDTVNFEQGAVPPPLLQLRPDMMRQLADALVPYASKVPATEDALQDTRTVRDRLLTLVERLTEQAYLTPQISIERST